MRPPRQFLVALLVAVSALTGCGRLAPKTFGAVTVVTRRPETVRDARDSRHRSTTSEAGITPIAAASLALAVRHHDEQIIWTATVAAAGTAVPAPAAPHVAQAAPAVPASSGLAPCDGDLPPCWRIIGIESGGRWDAHNATGCVEHGIVYQCWGPYQFSGSWAGKLGLPLDLWTTTHDQWISAARQLWNGGTGCANWQACG